MMLEHPKIVPRSRKTLDFSRVGVASGGSAFHHVVALVQVVVEMYKRPQGGSGGARASEGGGCWGGVHSHSSSFALGAPGGGAPPHTHPPNHLWTVTLIVACHGGSFTNYYQTLIQHT